MRIGCLTLFIAAVMGLLFVVQSEPRVVNVPIVMATPTVPSLDIAWIERGVTVYRTNYCGMCHSLGVALTTGRFGPSHDDALIAAERALANPNYGGSATTSAEYLRESILAPEMYVTVGYEMTVHHMPPFVHLSDDDLNALVYLLSNQRGQ